MNCSKKIAMMMFHLVGIILFCFPVSGMDADEAPKHITIGALQELYEKVIFDHQTHMDMYDCSSCHHHTLGTVTENENCKRCHVRSGRSGEVSCSYCHIKQIAPIRPDAGGTVDGNLYHIDKPSLKGALHLQCLGCHRSEGGPVGCRECHVFTQAGRDRFSLKNEENRLVPRKTTEVE